MLTVLSAYAVNVPIEIFPMGAYDQNIDTWVPPTAPDYDKPLIKSADQAKRLEEFYKHTYSTDSDALSPWSKNYVNEKIKGVGEKQQKAPNGYSNKGKEDPKDMVYGENFRPHSDKWIEDITANMNLRQFAQVGEFKDQNRGIVVRNLNARGLPTMDVSFDYFVQPGSGYPFDNLQESSLWIGAPVYIVGKTQDQQWCLVLTTSFMAWVQSDCIVQVDDKFVTEWQTSIRQKMIAIINTEASVFDSNSKYRFSAYVGSVFPGKNCGEKDCNILIPVVGEDGDAHIVAAKVASKDAAVMPLSATPRNFTRVMSTLLGRPYGWGNMYFYNDCSSELKSFYTPFGIWLPRDSGPQLKAGIGRVVDLSSLSMKERINHLMEKGRKFTTMIYINGHVMAYMGKHSNLYDSSEDSMMAMTYQNIWPLAPKDRSFRSVIGGSVLFPMLEHYPENKELNSLANKPQFQLIYLDEFPDNDDNKQEL
jgi:hypothetical protein